MPPQIRFTSIAEHPAIETEGRRHEDDIQRRFTSIAEHPAIETENYGNTETTNTSFTSIAEHPAIETSPPDRRAPASIRLHQYSRTPSN